MVDLAHTHGNGKLRVVHGCKALRQLPEFLVHNKNLSKPGLKNFDIAYLMVFMKKFRPRFENEIKLNDFSLFFAQTHLDPGAGTTATASRKTKGALSCTNNSHDPFCALAKNKKIHLQPKQPSNHAHVLVKGFLKEGSKTRVKPSHKEQTSTMSARETESPIKYLVVSTNNVKRISVLMFLNHIV